MNVLASLERKIGRVTVCVDALEEDSPDLSWDETGEVAHDIDAGRFFLFCARVRIRIGPYVGETYLGNCIYRDLEDFVACGDYYRSLVSEAIAELRDKVHGAKASADYWTTQVAPRK